MNYQRLDGWIVFSEDDARGIAEGAINQAAKLQVSPTRSEIAFHLPTSRSVAEL